MTKSPVIEKTARKQQPATNRGIRQRGDSYQVRLMHQGLLINGTFSTLAEARAFRDAKLAAAVLDPDFKRVLEARQRRAEGEHTVAAALERYLQEETPKKKGASEETYKIGKLLRYPIARRNMYNLSPSEITDFLNQLRAEGLADGGCRHYALLLSALYRTAIRSWHLPLDNPVQRIELPRAAPARNRRLEPVEEKYLFPELAAARNRFVLPYIAVAIESAMRRGELLTLTWDNVNIVPGEGIGTALLPDTKNSEMRSVPLSTKAVSILLSLPAPAETGAERVFPLEIHQLRSAWDFAKKRARAKYEQDCAAENITPDDKVLRDLRVHDLRHEAVSRLFELGVFTTIEIASISGHKTLQILKGYTHLRAINLARKMANK